MAKGDIESLRQIPSDSEEPEEVLRDGEPDMGTLEAQQLSTGAARKDLKRMAEEADYQRSQIFKTHFENMAILAFWIMFVVFIAVGVSWAWHLVVPQRGWLTHDQVDDLQGLLTGGVIAGVLADHVRRRMS